MRDKEDLLPRYLAAAYVGYRTGIRPETIFRKHFKDKSPGLLWFAIADAVDQVVATVQNEKSERKFRFLIEEIEGSVQ